MLLSDRSQGSARYCDRALENQEAEVDPTQLACKSPSGGLCDGVANIVVALRSLTTGRAPGLCIRPHARPPPSLRASGSAL